MNKTHLSLIAVFIVFAFVGGLFGYGLGNTPVYAQSPSGISGEYVYVPYRNPSAEFYVQEFSVLSTVTTTVAVSTACPEVDVCIIQYEDIDLAKVATAIFNAPLGTVTGDEVTLTRHTDPSVITTETVVITFIDYDFISL